MPGGGHVLIVTPPEYRPRGMVTFRGEVWSGEGCPLSPAEALHFGITPDEMTRDFKWYGCYLGVVFHEPVARSD